MAKSFSPDIESQQMIDYVEQSIFSVAQGRSIKDTSDLRDIVLENIQLMDERARNKGSLLDAAAVGAGLLADGVAP